MVIYVPVATHGHSPIVAITTGRRKRFGSLAGNAASRRPPVGARSPRRDFPQPRVRRADDFPVPTPLPFRPRGGASRFTFHNGRAHSWIRHHEPPRGSDALRQIFCSLAWTRTAAVLCGRTALVLPFYNLSTSLCVQEFLDPVASSCRRPSV
jgi:hypothetical protein